MKSNQHSNQERKKIVATLSDLEYKLYTFIKEIKHIDLNELRKINPKYLGPLGKLKSLHLIEISKPYKKINNYRTMKVKMIKYIPTIEEIENEKQRN